MCAYGRAARPSVFVGRDERNVSGRSNGVREPVTRSDTRVQQDGLDGHGCTSLGLALAIVRPSPPRQRLVEKIATCAQAEQFLGDAVESCYGNPCRVGGSVRQRTFVARTSLKGWFRRHAKRPNTIGLPALL